MDRMVKSHTVICDAQGQRKVTSTTEQLRIPASQILPGDWLLKPHRRGLAKDKRVKSVERGADLISGSWAVNVFFELGRSCAYLSSQMIDVERTT